MLVVEKWNVATAATHDRDGVVEELLPRIHLLCSIVCRVVTVLDNRQHRVYCEVAPAHTKCFIDRTEQWNSKRLRHVSRHVVFRKLVSVKRHNFHAGVGKLAIEQIRFEKILEKIEG